MYSTILVPVDTSTKNEAVFQRARSLADADQTRILLLHVVEMLQDVEFEEMEDFYNDLREQAESKLSEWADALASDGFDVQMEVPFGNRGPVLLDAVDEFDVDLIMLRSHVFDEDDPEESLGTFSHQLALFAPCSVLLVRE